MHLYLNAFLKYPVFNVKYQTQIMFKIIQSIFVNCNNNIHFVSDNLNFPGQNTIFFQDF